jgi:hypothetical protein
MGYVPGYRHDLFISYAHGDDREWINRFVDRLEPALTQRLGFRPVIWIDEDDLRRSRDFSREIPEAVRASAVFLFLASPTYIRSRYCVDEECRAFQDLVPGRRLELGADFANDLFALRCLIVPVDDNEHWALFPGLTDIAFCNESEALLIGSPEFDVAFRGLVGESVALLKRLRHRSTAVFLYPPNPGPDLREAHTLLAAELSARSFRILPDRSVNVDDQLRGAALSIFLLGADYDDGADRLVEVAQAHSSQPWVVWCSPAADQTAVAEQQGFCAHLEQVDSPRKTFLNAEILPNQLKEEILGLLRPDARALPETRGKPRVYLVYNARDRAEAKNAGLISFHFRKTFHFEHPDDPTQHATRLSKSDAVMLVWGHADEEWCSREFDEMIRSPRQRDVRHGLCLFDPSATKLEAVRQIRSGFADLFIGEQFGKFDPSRLATFFDPLLRHPSGGPP